MTGTETHRPFPRARSRSDGDDCMINADRSGNDVLTAGCVLLLEEEPWLRRRGHDEPKRHGCWRRRGLPLPWLRSPITGKAEGSLPSIAAGCPVGSDGGWGRGLVIWSILRKRRTGSAARAGRSIPEYAEREAVVEAVGCECSDGGMLSSPKVSPRAGSGDHCDK